MPPPPWLSNPRGRKRTAGAGLSVWMTSCVSLLADDKVTTHRADCDNKPAMLARDVTVVVKHTPGFASRTRKLTALLTSIRLHHGHELSILVATEGRDDGLPLHAATHEQLRRNGLVNEFVVLPRGSGLSAGRNALIHAVKTPFAALMDDDLLLLDNASLPVMHAALVAHPEAAVAGGCHQDLKRGMRDCFNMVFGHSDDGAIVTSRRARLRSSPHAGCMRVHVTHNFFIGRVELLRRLGWDPRQRVMEHETFFYQLYLNSAAVLACPHAIAAHDTRAARDDAYEMQSLRATEGLEGRDPGSAYLQYLCKNLPGIRRFHTPFTSWHCDAREFCTPLWDAQFAFDGQHCAPFAWDASDDASTVVRPLLAPHDDLHDEFVPEEGERHRRGGRGRSPSFAPLLALVLTQRQNVARRAWQRSTWLSFGWHALHQRDGRGGLTPSDGDRPVPWRYVYVMRTDAVDAAQDRSPQNSSYQAAAGEILGDVVSLRATDRPSLVLAAVRWALARVDFQCLLLTDDRGLVHIGRIWEWMLTYAPDATSRLLAWRRPNAGRKPAVTSDQLAASSGSFIAGRATCKQLVQAGRTGRGHELDVNLVSEPPGFLRKAGVGDRQQGGPTPHSPVSGQMLIDGVRHRPFETFRMLLQARGHPAVWQNHRAFARPGCSGCESRFFPNESPRAVS